MAEILYPGIYTQEVPSGKVTAAGISTSNGGLVGFTPKGPVNDPQLVTDWPAFVRKFGSFTALSDTPTHVYAFFANGGKRAWINRCVGAGAVKASGFLENHVEEEVIETGDGATLIFTGTLTYNPVKAAVGACAISFWKAGAAVVAQASDMSPTPNGVATSFTGKLGLAGADTPVVPETVNIADITAPGAVYTDFAPNSPSPGNGILYDVGNTARGYVNYVTGHFSLTVGAVVPLLPGNVTYDYTPVGAVETLVDNGASPIGALTSANASGTITRATGDYTFTVVGAPNAPSNHSSVLCTYIQNNHPFELNWEGLAGNDVSALVMGDPNYYTPATATYARYKLQVWQVDDDGVNQLAEVFDQLSFTTTTDAHYLLEVVNNEDTGSDLITIAAPSDTVGPDSLGGLNRVRAVSAGNGVATQFGSSGATPTIANPFVTGPLETPVQRGSVSIAYADTGGVTRTIIDDGEGNLTGASIDPAAAAGFNVIDYATGQFAFQVLLPVATATVGTTRSIVLVSYYKEPTDDSITNDPAGGTDGTLPLTRTELTNPTLKADYEGIYAFLGVNELLNLVVPDALNAADPTVMYGDITTECATPDNGRWFPIFAVPQGKDPLEAQRWRLTTYGYTGAWGALYYPWLRIADPVTDLIRNFPPGGHIAGVYANSDAIANIGTGPAGITRATLQFCQGMEYKLKWPEVGLLYPYEINSLIDMPQTGRVVWGADTLQRPAGDFRYVHSRRLVNFVRLSIFESTHGFVFENVGASLWSRVRTFAESFLGNLYRNGYFGGDTPRQAYFVVCDDTNNSIDSEYVYCDIGIRPNRMAKFIVFRITLIAPESV